MLSVRVLQFQISGCPSEGCARHKIVLTPFVLITDSRVDGCPWAWTTDNSACKKEKMAGGIVYVPCMVGRKSRVETEVWQLVMSSGPTGIFVGVWDERCRTINGFIVYKWHIRRFSCMHLSERSHKGCLWERCNHLKNILLTFTRKDNSLRINRLVGLLENWVMR